MRIRSLPIPCALLSLATPAFGQIGSAPQAPEILARAVLAGSLDDDTEIKVNARLEIRTVAVGVHEEWVVFEGTALTNGQPYDINLELGVPSDLTMTILPASGGQSLVFTHTATACSSALTSSSTPMSGGTLAVVSAEHATNGFSIAGAVVDNDSTDNLPPEAAFQSRFLLLLVAHFICNVACVPSAADALMGAGSACGDDGIKSFSYSCNPQTGEVSLSFECEPSDE